MPLNPRSWETDPKKILVAVRSLKNFSARGLEEPTVHQRYVKFGVPLDLFNLRCEHRLCREGRRKQSTSVSVLVRALQGGKTHPGRDQSSICVHSLTSLERDVACCHGAHGLAVNSVVPITPVNLMAPYTISSWRWYLQTHLPPKGITKTTHTGV
jgi:hypothetical protein